MGKELKRGSLKRAFAKCKTVTDPYNLRDLIWKHWGFEQTNETLIALGLEPHFEKAFYLDRVTAAIKHLESKGKFLPQLEN